MSQEPVTITNVNVFDTDAGTLRRGLDVRIENGRVRGIGEDLSHDGTKVLDGGGRTLLPGLIDCHVHLTFMGAANESLTPTDPLAFYAWRASGNALKTLAAGYTMVRDLGATQAVNCDLARAIREGMLVGPRVIAAGRMITMTGGHGWPVGREADGADDVRKAVREQLKVGAKVIKMMASGGVMTPNVDPRSAQLGLDELSAGVEEAHKAGVKTASHAQATAGIKNAVHAGIDSIEHGIYLDDEVIEEMKRRGTYLVATLAAPMNINRLGKAGGVPAFVLDKAQMIGQTHSDSFKKAMKAGVRLACGTDAGTPGNLHGENVQELRLMVEHGLSPVEAIRAATANAAELCGMGDETGRIVEGYLADLLLVNGDPLQDIRVLERPENIAGVLVEGRLLHSSGHFGEGGSAAGWPVPPAVEEL